MDAVEPLQWPLVQRNHWSGNGQKWNDLAVRAHLHHRTKPELHCQIRHRERLARWKVFRFFLGLDEHAGIGIRGKKLYARD